MNLVKLFRIPLMLGMIAISVLFIGCPYESTVPIDDDGIKVPKSLYGKWVTNEELSQEIPTYFIVEKADKNKFRITKNEYSSTDETYTQTMYTGHISKIQQTDFMNIIEDESSTYYLYKVIWNGDKQLTMHEITSNITEKFNSSKELKDFISKYMHLSFFYNTSPETYFKQ
jgi:hypothetical protein